MQPVNTLDNLVTMSMNGASRSDTTQLVLAECNPLIMQPLLASIEEEGWSIVGQCSTAPEVIQTLEAKRVDMLLLGKLEEANCFAVFRECRDRWHNLPVILLSHQPVSEFFRNWAIQRGVNDVVNADPKHFHILRKTIIQVLDNIPPDAHSGPLSPPIVPPTPLPSQVKQEQLTYGLVRDALSELTGLGTNYFGSLAIGNYWRKAHKKAIAEHPWLDRWSIDHFGQVTISEELQTNVLDSEQIQSVQVWVRFFLQECQRIIVDFPILLSKNKLSSCLQRLLSP